MKIALLPFCLAAASAFSAHPVATTRSSRTDALRAASSLRPDGKKSEFDKPLHKVASTVPVASPKALSERERAKLPDVMLDADYILTIGVAALCPLIIWYHPSYDPAGGPSLIGVAGGLFHALFAALLWVQTRRVRCVFEKDSFEFYNIKGPKLDLEKGAWLETKPDNYVVGTLNRWKYDKITNYGFFPSLEFPVIVFFKETETDEKKWNRWFAAFDGYGRGQPHFFPGKLVGRNKQSDDTST
ncbi:hypothetical protein MPSEU_000377700 [Mayamaea pseudoterrestris]|nr:hypothetical protein MPSEU_000377700 [Mayamaea pseudoterrestris]